MASVADSGVEPLDESEGFDELSSTARIYKLLAHELGEEMADAFAQTRALQERLARRRHPGDGLREQKKRLTRQRISDVATTLFVVRGFEHVTVSEIARIVGVSEKTVFNYFPTKESLVFDRADEGVERLAEALRERDAGESPTKAMLRALSEEPEELEELPDAIHMFMPLFSEMVAATPALNAAWLALHARLVEVATQALAEHAEVDPRDPEPMIAARAIVGLLEVEYASRIRHIEAGLRGAELREAVNADLERAARMLDTGLWSFGLLTQGTRTHTQLREAAVAAEEARTQVIDALKHARAAWQELRQSEQQERRAHDRDERAGERERRKREHAELKREIKQAAKQVAAGERRAAKRSASRAGEAAWQAARKQGKKSLREAHEMAERAAFEAFRQKLGERHEAIREREAALRREADDR
ncbi:MAG TPA: TetR family transcriptional regulator [Solirubrobacteraceae bacterium]|jgi:AcrR family transcriptional regulator|nr:TetR family transcriptional regulator [Solirubrobacteraceae bacterium]